MTLEQEGGENGGLCHLHYQDVDRKAPCAQIVAVMRSEPSIPTHAQLVFRPSHARYEEISRLLQALRDSGYNLKIGHVNVAPAQP